MKLSLLEKLLFAIALTLAAGIMTILTSGCSSSKKSTQEKQTVDSTYIHKSDSLAREINKISDNYEKLISEMSSNKLEFDNEPCPPQEIRIDSVNCSEDSLIAIIRQQAATIRNYSNKIKVYADGSFEASGKLKSFSSDLQKVQQETHKLAIENDRLKYSNDSLYTQLKVAQSASSKEKTSIWPWIWLGVLIGFALATVLWKWKTIIKLLRF